MSIKSQRENTSATKLPMMLAHLTTFNLFENYILDEELFESSTFSVERKINIHESGTPLHCTLFKTQPTSCQTPGKSIPAGYTPSGKWKGSHWTPTKTDKRAGK